MHQPVNPLDGIIITFCQIGEIPFYGLELDPPLDEVRYAFDVARRTIGDIVTKQIIHGDDTPYAHDHHQDSDTAFAYYMSSRSDDAPAR